MKNKINKNKKALRLREISHFDDNEDGKNIIRVITFFIAATGIKIRGDKHHHEMWLRYKSEGLDDDSNLDQFKDKKNDSSSSVSDALGIYFGSFPVGFSIFFC